MTRTGALEAFLSWGEGRTGSLQPENFIGSKQGDLAGYVWVFSAYLPCPFTAPLDVLVIVQIKS